MANFMNHVEKTTTPISKNKVDPPSAQQTTSSSNRHSLNPRNKQMLDLLADYILDSEEQKAIELLETFDASTIEDLLKYRAGDKDDDPMTMDGDVSMLALASAYSVSSELMSLLASKCPDLLSVHREYPYEGQTPIHTLVSKENFPAVEAILSQMRPDVKARLLKMSTVTDRMEPVNATVMLGGLPLSIAALTFNLKFVDLLIEHGADLCGQNDRGDTVFHSLVRFSALYPEKEEEAEETMKVMHCRLRREHEPRSVWLVENNQGLTVLKLAAQCTQPRLFNFIVTLKGVYCDLDEHDGLFDSLLYDITDIDPVALKQFMVTLKEVYCDLDEPDGLFDSLLYDISGIDPIALKQVSNASTTITTEVKHNQVDAVQDLPDLKKITKKQGGFGTNSSSTTTTPPPPPPPYQPPPQEDDRSILEIIYETQNVHDAFKILDNHVVHRVIQDKWQRFEPLFIVWTILHLAMMVWLTVYAVYKSHVVSHQELSSLRDGNTNTSVVISSSEEVSKSGEQFVIGTAVASALWAEAWLLYELVRLFRRRSLRKYLVTLLFHHNGFYRLQLIVFHLGLLLDAIFLAFWYWKDLPPNNYCLIVALLVGWWFTAFFLRPWKKFSFFTVMVQEVLIGDMLRFSTIFIPQLMAFSVAMHITFTPGGDSPEEARPRPAEFQTVGRTMMTMFKLMLGLADVEVLYEARESWLAIGLFVMYVLLTYSLMLNALIALMSNTCSIVSQNRENQWKLQRMAIVLFLQESLWSCRFLSVTGKPRDIRIEDLQKKQTTTKTRYVMKISSVRGGDGGSVIHKAVKNLAEGETGDTTEDPQTSVDMFDLLAAMNFQRKQKLLKLQKKEEPSSETVPTLDTVDGEKGVPNVNITVNQHQETTNKSYINIRNSIQKTSSKRPRSPAAAIQGTSAPAHIPEPDGRLLAPPSNPEPRQLLNTVPEIHPIPQQSPKIVLLPSPCLITTFEPEAGKLPPYMARHPELKMEPDQQEAETKRSRKLAKKREKFRQRPDSADLEERFRKRREELVKSRRKAPSPPDEPKAPTSRRGSGFSGVGIGVFPVEDSRIHMHSQGIS